MQPFPKHEQNSKRHTQRNSSGTVAEQNNNNKNAENVKKVSLADKKTVSDKKVKSFSLIQKIINAYKEIKGFDKIANWDKVNFPRFVRDANKLLLLGENNIDLIVRGIKAIGMRWDSKDYDWNLSTVVRSFPEYLVEKKEER